MKKILLFAGCVFATMSVLAGDALYNYDEGTKSYIYQGEPVSEFSVDFNTWASDALGAADWLDNTTAREAGNMAFVKWCINSRNIYTSPAKEGKETFNMAFNNGTTSDPTPVRNATDPKTSNFPRIYLPTTARGVDSIVVEICVNSNNARYIHLNYKDDNNKTWKYAANQALLSVKKDADGTAILQKATMALNTTGPTTIYLQYAYNDYFYVKSIKLYIAKEATTPTVEIDKHEAILYPGKEVQLEVTKVFPSDAKITWTSSNEAVATVADGKVLGTGKGEAFIFATIDGAKDSCKITGETYTYYPLGNDSLFHYVGDPFEDEVLVLDFEQDLQASDVLYYDAKTSTFADRMLEWMDGMAGLYKWGYYASRTMGGVAKGPVLWGNGACENGGTNAIKTDGNTEKLPAIYFPTIKNGVKYIVVEGSSTNNRTLICDIENAEGKWTQSNKVVPAIGDKYYLNVKKNEWAADTLNINSADVKNIRLWRNSTDYMFITKITIVPMEKQPATNLFDQKAIAPAKKEMRNGQIIIRKNDSMYNILGAEVK